MTATKPCQFPGCNGVLTRPAKQSQAKWETRRFCSNTCANRDKDSQSPEETPVPDNHNCQSRTCNQPIVQGGESKRAWAARKYCSQQCARNEVDALRREGVVPNGSRPHKSAMMLIDTPNMPLAACKGSFGCGPVLPASQGWRQATPNDDTVSFPCPVCFKFFKSCIEKTNHMGVVEALLTCPDGHGWEMRWVSPVWTATA